MQYTPAADQIERSPAWLVWLRSKPALGIVCLIISSTISYISIFHGRFGDEGDVLSVGQLLARGDMLYRDIFSHHFPLSYYWLAGAFSIFGSSLYVARVSMIGFGLLMFGVTMYASRLYIAVGLTALLWGSIGLFYFGNMVLYQSFSGLLILSICVITVTVLLGGFGNPGSSVILGVIAFLAILNNPLTIFPICIAFACILSKARTFVLITLTTLSLCASVYVAYLFFTHTLGDFYQQAILFNLNIYPKYTSAASSNYFSTLFSIVSSGLYLFDTKHSMYPIETISSYNVFSRFVLSDILYKSAIILSSGLFLLL
jgi:hypothetical protein